ncbi:MAG: DASS family sodium-coupled anion symporter [Candidatus Aminicenantes bacterium]|nr:DASS family sodium-coupled anion symporter [Candidatus Aminicenantes bacterium]
MTPQDTSTSIRTKRLPLTKTIFLVLAIAAGLVFILQRPPQGLSPEGSRCIGVAIICFSLWVLQSIPLAATSLLAVILLPTFNVLGRAEVFSYFGNSAVFFLIGVFILAAAIIRTGLSKRLAFLFISRFGKTPRGLLFGVVVTASLFALFMPAHAVAAMMFPVVLEIATALHLERGRSPLGKSLFLGLAWGAVVGSIGTYLGGARVPLAVEFLRKSYDRTVSFETWALAATPAAIILTFIVFFIVSRFFPSERRDVSGAKAFLQAELQRLGRLSLGELKTALITGAAIILWITAGHRIGLAVVSIAAAIAVFIFRIAHWPEVNEYINWGVIVMYGGAIALGKALYETKAVEWLVNLFLGSDKISTWPLILLLSGLALFITEAISNAAAVVILVPLSFGFVAHTGLSPELMTMIVTIPTGLAFCLPVGTPPNAIAYSAGYFHVKDSLTVGLLLKIIAWAVFLLSVRFYWPLLGMGM